MSMSALPDTDTLKVIITMEEMMDLERKGQQSVQGNIYVRLVAFDNGSLSALHDRSDGFYRRQLTLRVKEKDSARIDDPNLGDKLKEEAEGIVLWSVEGLKRLQANNYHFTISEQTRQIMEEIRRNDNSMIDFYESTGYIMFEVNTHATTRQLFNAYRCWCEDNALTPLSERTFANQLRTDEKRLGISYTKNLEVGAGKRARGYVGVHTQLSDDRLWSFKRWGGG